MTDRLCLLDRDPERKPATAGLLCGGHAFQLRRALNSIRDNWCEASDSTRGDRYDFGGSTFGRQATRVHSPVPIDLGAIDRDAWSRAHAGRLAFWSRAVASSRAIAPASFPGSTLGRIDLLLLHLPWIIAQPAVVEFAAEVLRIEREIARRVGRNKLGQVIGLCQQRTTTGRCDGELLRDRAGIIRCHRDPSHIDHVRAKPREQS